MVCRVLRESIISKAASCMLLATVYVQLCCARHAIPFQSERCCLILEFTHVRRDVYHGTNHNLFSDISSTLPFFDERMTCRMNDRLRNHWSPTSLCFSSLASRQSSCLRLGVRTTPRCRCRTTSTSPQTVPRRSRTWLSPLLQTFVCL